MIESTDITNLVLMISAILGVGFAPIVVFFARLWQKQIATEQRLDASIEVRKQIQEQMTRQQDIFNPQFQKALIDIAVMTEQMNDICSRLERMEKRLFNGDHERDKT